MNISVSLLISTYNWKDALTFCLYSVFSQTVKPDEILIADDGSREDTRQLIDQLRSSTNIPIIHVWQEDKGFRLSAIRNRAIALAKGNYIIQIDGDVILNKYFIADHLEIAEQGYFVCGSRVGLGPKSTKHIFNGINYSPLFLKQGLKYLFNGLRSRVLRTYLSKNYAQKNIPRLRGCNMAFWKEDLLKVNGYNEDLTMWGQEDVEISYRLIHA
ncbi:MAG: glycosyltransferase family 2 protein, partial [Bacteroidaceae bacterium]